MRISTLRRFISIQDPPPRGSRRVDESGLTTLEWLLIVAAVAGLAALAVVLVTSVVDNTAEKISDSSARRTAAVLAATEIMRDADQDAAQQPSGAKTYATWSLHYTRKCNRLEITYGDAGIMATADFNISNVTASDSVDADDIDKANDIIVSGSKPGGPDASAQGWRNVSAASSKALAECFINAPS